MSDLAPGDGPVRRELNSLERNRADARLLLAVRTVAGNATQPEYSGR
jgi:hypothetical protein